MIVHIVFNNYAYDQRVKKEVNALRESKHVVKVIAKENGDISFNTRNYPHFLLLTFKSLFKLKPGIIHAHDWYGLLPAFLYSVFIKSFLIYDAHELYFNRKMHLRERIIVGIEKLALLKVNKIICANEYRARIFKLVHKTNDILILSNSYFFKPAGHNKLNLENLNIVYMGSMSLARNIEKWIIALKEIENINLHLIGNGPDYNYLKNSYEKQNISFYGNLTHFEMKFIMESMHVGIISYNEEGLNNYYCEPNKVGEYAYFGLPFISNYNYTLNLIERKYQIGYTLTHISTDAIREIIQEIKSNYVLLRSNLDLFMSQNSWDIEKNKLIEYYAEIDRT